MKRDSNPIDGSKVSTINPTLLAAMLTLMRDVPELIIASGSNSDDAIDATLAKIGTLFSASRAYVMLDEKDARYLRNTHEWVDVAAGQAMYSWPLYDYEYDIPSMRHILDTNDIFCSHTKSLPDDLQRILIKQNVHSLFLVPLVSEGTRVGLLGLDFCDAERECDEAIRQVLLFAAPQISLMLERKQYQRMRSKLGTIMATLADVNPILTGYVEEKEAPRPVKPVTLLDSERRIIIETLEYYNGNKLKTAKHLGLTWPSLDRRCKKLGIEVKRK